MTPAVRIRYREYAKLAAEFYEIQVLQAQADAIARPSLAAYNLPESFRQMAAQARQDADALKPRPVRSMTVRRLSADVAIVEDRRP